jgi:hypothetical protein
MEEEEDSVILYCKKQDGVAREDSTILGQNQQSIRLVNHPA